MNRKRHQGCVRIEKRPVERKEAVCQLRRKPSGEPSPAGNLMMDFSPPELQENKILLFKPSSWWDFVTAALKTLVLKLNHWTFCQVPTPFTLSSVIKVQIRVFCSFVVRSLQFRMQPVSHHVMYKVFLVCFLPDQPALSAVLTLTWAKLTNVSLLSK